MNGLNRLKAVVKLAVALVAVSTGCHVLAAEKHPKAILFMLDGLRADAVESGQMPNLVRLQKGEWRSGYGCAWTLSGFVNSGVAPESAPNHVSIATGVTYLKHKVTANGQTGSGDYANYPTWLKRVVTADSNRSALFAYSWAEDAQLGPADGVEFVSGTDAANSATVSARLAAADAPDATMFYINCPDAGGHASGYYPHGTSYVENVAAADSYIGACLDAIAGRATFAEENWLILVTSDHGGLTADHAGAYGRHSLTVPVLVAGPGVSAGPVSGVVYNYDLTANALAHFGIDAAACSLDARAVAGFAAASRSLADGLSVYLPFDNFDNCVSDSSVTAIANDATKATIADNGFTGKGLKIVSGGKVELDGSEGLEYEDSGKSFAITVWVRQNQSAMTGDPLVWGNKDWASGKNKGLALVANGNVSGNPKNYGSGVFFNYVTTDTERHDVGQFLNEGSTLWNFYAVTRTDDGVLRVYQGRRDGRLYWLSDEAAELTLSQTGYPFYLGSDGKGTYAKQYVGEMDEFALWTRGLSHEEIRKVYETGRRGQELGEILTMEALDAPTVSVSSYNGTAVTLAFGGVRTSPYTLCVASGAIDAGEDKYAWDYFATVAEIAAGTSQYVFALPDDFKSESRKFRFFLLKASDLPFTKELQYLESAGTSAVDTEIYPRSGTEISLDVSSTEKNGNYDWFFGSFWNDGTTLAKAGNFGAAFGNKVSPAKFYYETSSEGGYFLPYAFKTTYHVDYSTSSIAVNGESALTGRTPDGFKENGYPIELFRNRRNLAAYDQTVKGRIGNVTLRADGETVRELVPVADLTGKGAYFDRVTGRIFPEVAGTPLTLGTERDAARLGWVRAMSPTLDSDAARVVVACWTGQGETSAVNDPGNWACTNAIGEKVSGLPTADTTVYVSGQVSFSLLPGETIEHAGKIVMKDFRLTGDSDLRGLDMADISDDSTIDLNGRNLTFVNDAETSAAFAVTDSSSGTEPGRLHFVVSASKTVDIPSRLNLSGNIRIVKDGQGTILAKSASRGHLGGFEVAAGTIKLGAAISGTSAPFGPSGSKIIVDAGAVLDPCGYSGLERYMVVLAGGTVSNSSGNAAIGSLMLTADSTIEYPDTTANHDLSVKGSSTWDLGGKTLTITFAGSDPDLYFNDAGVVIRNGTIVNTGNGYFNMYAGVDMSDGATLDIATRLRLHLTGVKVDNLINRTTYEDVASRSSDGKTDYYMSLSGRFTPLSPYCYFMLLQDGATVDLKDRTDAWPVETTVTSGGTPYVTRTKFADGATIVVDLIGRTDLVTGSKIIDFGSEPVSDSVNFKLPEEIDDDYMLVRRSDGLYVEVAVKTAVWTGKAGTADCTNPANWTCYDAKGNVIDDVLPGSITAVTLSGEVQLDIPANSGFSCATFTCNNVSLKGDCDWSGLGRPMSGQIDLAGYNLTMSSLTGDATITSSADAGYEILEYIDSDGKAYVSTGATVANNTVIDIKLQLLKAPSGYVSYVGARAASDSSGQLGGWFRDLMHYRGVTESVTQIGPAALNTDYLVHLDKNGPCTINGGDPFATGNGYGDGSEITVFGLNQGGTVYFTGAFRVYFCTIANGSEVQRKLKPARRLSDGALGLLDVNAAKPVFYANANSAGAFSAGPVASDALAHPAELHVVVPEGQTAENSTVAITGGVRVVKGGAGTLAVKKAGQTYAGGTVVAGGTLATFVDFSTLPCGIAGSAITVGKGAVLDRKGSTGLDSYRLVLDGGMLTCSYNPADGDHGCTIRDLDLTADSRIVFDSALTASADINILGTAVWELNGHVLDIVFDGPDPDVYARNGMTLRHGTIRTTMAKSGWFHDEGINGKDGGCLDISTILRLQCKGTGGAGTYSTISNLTVRTLNDSVASDGYQMVYGAYTPLSGYAYKVEMQDGSTINLGELEGAWPITPLNGSAGTATFAAGATINVEFGERKIDVGEKVIGWTPETAPAKGVKFLSKLGKLRKMSDGAYYMQPFVILIR